MKTSLRIALGISLVLPVAAHALVRPEKIHVTDSQKLEAYIEDGLFVGGDRAVDDVTVKGIRFSRNATFERIVIDLEPRREGESLAIERPPYFQVSVSPDEGRLVVSLFGSPKLEFNATSTERAFQKSRLIRRSVFLPRVEDQVWTFSFETQSRPSVEVFELKNPTRIVVDLKARANKKIQ